MTDASDCYWSICITQCTTEDLEKHWREQSHAPIAMCSGAFKGSELNWSVTCKEAYPLFRAVERFKHVICRAAPFWFFTDHLNLLCMFDPTARWKVGEATQGRLARWAMVLRETDHKLKHMPGDQNLWADLHTRMVRHDQVGARRVCRVATRRRRAF